MPYDTTPVVRGANREEHDFAPTARFYSGAKQAFERPVNRPTPDGPPCHSPPGSPVPFAWRDGRTSPEARQARGRPSKRLVRSNPLSCRCVLAGEGSDAFPSVETARVHHAARRRGSDVAGGGTRSAA